VYAAGEEYASEHPNQVLHQPDGSPWTLADFVWIVQLVDYRAQPDARWNVTREVGGPASGLRLRLRVALEVGERADDIVVDVPEFTTWVLVVEG
jgi:hypothetical protein